MVNKRKLDINFAQFLLNRESISENAVAATRRSDRSRYQSIE